MYEFTSNWFETAADVWPVVVTKQLLGKPPGNLLEIGSYEGRSAVWLIENAMQEKDTLYCVDTWSGSEEHKTINMSAVERRFDRNIERAVNAKGFYRDQVAKRRGASCAFLPSFIVTDKKFKFIYIDGSHRAADVLSDAVMAWHVLSKGGVMVFDDYLWRNPVSDDPLGTPSPAIDAFLHIYRDQMHVLHRGYQIIVAKV